MSSQRQDPNGSNKRCGFPERRRHEGDSVCLEPLSAEHVGDLWNAASGAENTWQYLRYGPFKTIGGLAEHVEELASREHQPFWGVRSLASGKVLGWLSLCDIYPEDAAIEVGSIWFSPALQRTRMATEAIFLLLAHAADDLGYRRLVWRCCAPNLASREAALRYGFIPEGTWRRAVIVRGQEMDVCWFSMQPDEWRQRRLAIADWLRADNFDERGRAKCSLRR
jgi:RimJ/RimL family protein N-acetyltransferase